MNKPLVTALSLMLGLWIFLPEALAQSTFTLHFESNSAQPLESDLTEFHQWLGQQEDAGKTSAFLVGHTDTKSTETFNDQLAENRTTAVAMLLRDLGFSDIAARSFGESQPKCREQIAACDRLNRRVEITLMAPIELTNYLLDTMSEQVFFIHPAQSNMIKGSQGTVLEFPAKCFAYANKTQVKDSVRIVLKEYYHANDFLARGLTTTSQGRLLTTGGTLFVSGTCDDEPVRIASGMSFNAFFTGRIQDDLMKAFMGKSLNGLIDWELVNSERLDFLLPDLAQSLDRTLVVEAQKAAEDFIRSKGDRSGRKGYIDVQIMVNDRPTRLLYRPFVPSLVESKGGLVIPQMGWINCDRFLRSKETLVEVRTKACFLGATCYLVLPESKGIMPAYSSGADGEVIFPNIPEGEPCTLVVLKRTNGTIEWSVCSFEAGRPGPEAVFRSGDELALKEALKSVIWEKS